MAHKVQAAGGGEGKFQSQRVRRARLLSCRVIAREMDIWRAVAEESVGGVERWSDTGGWPGSRSSISMDLRLNRIPCGEEGGELESGREGADAIRDVRSGNFEMDSAHRSGSIESSSRPVCPNWLQCEQAGLRFHSCQSRGNVLEMSEAGNADPKAAPGPNLHRVRFSA